MHTYRKTGKGEEAILTLRGSSGRPAVVSAID
jgi:hypothetical protein